MEEYLIQSKYIRTESYKGEDRWYTVMTTSAQDDDSFTGAYSRLLAEFLSTRDEFVHAEFRGIRRETITTDTVLV
jgi:uncharacterized protein (DUF427 family)